MDELIKFLITILSTTIVVSIACIVLVLHYYDTIKIIISDLLKPLKKLGVFSSKKFMSMSFEGRLNNALKKVTNDNSFINPFNVKVKFIDNNKINRETF